MEPFPAYAGVIPEMYATGEMSKAFPRIRGGDPKAQTVNALL